MQQTFNVEKAKAAGFSDAEIQAYMQERGLQPSVVAPQNPVQSPSEIAEDIGRPAAKNAAVRMPLSLLGGYAGSTLTGTGPVGFGAFTSAIDESLRALGEEESGGFLTSGEDPSVLGAVDQFLSGEAVGMGIGAGVRGLKGIGRGISEYFSPGSVIDPGLSTLNPTFSQYKNRPFFQTIEDVLNPIRKQTAINDSALQAKRQAEEMVDQQFGTKIDISLPLEREAQSLKSDLSVNYGLAVAEADRHAELAKLISTGNPHVIQYPATRDAQGRILKQGYQKVVEGPIGLSSTIVKAMQIVENVKSGVIKPDPNDRLVAAAHRLVQLANPVFDAKLKKYNFEPINFVDAWEIKKELGNYAASKFENRASFLGSQYRDLTTSLNRDIESSIPTWQNGGNDALEAWNASKRVVGAREAAFYPEGIVGKHAGTVRLNNATEVYPEINTIIDDSKKLQATLNAGDLDVLTQNAGGTVTSIQGTNTRKTLGAYQVKRMMQQAWEVNPYDKNGPKVFNSRKLKEMWEDPNMQDSFKILYNSKQRADIAHFFDTLSAIDQKMISGGSTYLKIRGAMGAMALGGGLTNYMLGGPMPYGTIAGGAITGAILSGHALGILLTNKDTARLMSAMAQGGPLNMSSQMAARTIAYALRNEPISMVMGEGTEIRGKLNADGRFVPDAKIDIDPKLNREVKIK